MSNTEELSARLEFTLADLGYQFPNYPVPAGETMDSFLRKRTDEGFRNRYATKTAVELFDRAERQIQRELALIEKAESRRVFPDCVGLVRFCREQKILCKARLRRKQRGLLFAGSHGGRPRENGTVIRRFLSENAASGPTSIWIFRAATSARKPFNTFIKDMASLVLR